MYMCTELHVHVTGRYYSDTPTLQHIVTHPPYSIYGHTHPTTYKGLVTHPPSSIYGHTHPTAYRDTPTIGTHPPWIWTLSITVAQTLNG